MSSHIILKTLLTLLILTYFNENNSRTFYVNPIKTDKTIFYISIHPARIYT